MFRRRKQFKVDASVGLEITASAVRAVEIKGQGREAMVQRIACSELPEGSVRAGRITDPLAVAGALRQLWEDGGFSTRRCVLALPAETLTPQLLTLPPAPPNEQRQIVRGELQRFTALQADTPFGWMPLAPGGGPGGNTLAFLCDAEVIAGCRQAASMAGLELESCEPGAIAALRAVPLGQLLEAPAAAVHITDTCSELAFLESGSVRYYRRLDLGIAELTGRPVGRPAAEYHDPDLAQFLAGQPAAGGKDLEPLILEIKRSLQYYARSYSGASQPQKVLLLGDHPLIERLAPLLGSELSLETEYHCPLHGSLQSAGQEDAAVVDATGWTVALGAAQRPLSDPRVGFVLDLQTPDEAQPLVRHAPRYLMGALASSTAVVLVTLGISMFLDTRLSQAKSSLSRADAELQAATAQRIQTLERVRQAHQQTAQLRQQALPVPQLLMMLGSLVPDAVSLSSIGLTDGGTLTLEGEASAPRQVNSLLQRLSYEPRFQAPLLQSMNASSERGAVRFRVQTGLVGRSQKQTTSG
jgi:type IV pilus assembly protein PilM